MNYWYEAKVKGKKVLPLVEKQSFLIVSNNEAEMGLEVEQEVLSLVDNNYFQYHRPHSGTSFLGNIWP